MRNVLVTADDFGLCPEIDDAICLLHDRGVVERTSLVVNTPQFESSVEALRRRPALEVAVHLNLTDGRPVLPAAQVPSLVDERGQFPGGRHYGIVAGIVSGRIGRHDVAHEWRAQVDKARRTGLPLVELNSHGHLHLLPHLHPVVVTLCKEFAIPRVRLVRSSERPRGPILGICSWLLRRRLQSAGLSPGPNGRTLGLRRPGTVDARIRLRELRSGQGGSLELVVHPSCGRNAYHDRWGYDGDAVMRWLLHAAGTGAPHA